MDGGTTFNDPIVIKWLTAAQHAKDVAVSGLHHAGLSVMLAEDFQSAKHIKVLLDIIKKKAEELSNVDNQKQLAIAKEDFDSAKHLKEDVERIKAQFLKQLEEQGYSLTPEGKLNYPKSPQIQLTSLIPGKLAEPIEAVQKHFDDQPISVKQQMDQPEPQASGSVSQLNTNTVAGVGASSASLEDRPLKPRENPVKLDEFDENSLPPGAAPSARKAPIKRKPKPKPAETEDAETKEVGDEEKKPAVKKVVKKVGAKKSPVKDKPVTEPADGENKSDEMFDRPGTPPFELDNPDSTHQSDYPEAYKVFSHAVVDCSLSKNFSKREWALQMIQERFSNANAAADLKTSHSIDDIIKATYYIIQICISDTREKVGVACLTLFKDLVDFQLKHETKNEAVKKIDAQFTALLAKTAEVNPRVKQLSLDLIILICNKYSTLTGQVFKTQGLNPKLLKGRLECAAKVLTDVDVSQNINEQTVLKWVATLWANPAGDIRDSATKIAAAMYSRLRKKGSPVPDARRIVLSVTSSVKPQIVSALKAQMDEIDGSFKPGPSAKAALTKEDVDQPAPKKKAKEKATQSAASKVPAKIVPPTTADEKTSLKSPSKIPKLSSLSPTKRDPINEISLIKPESPYLKPPKTASNNASRKNTPTPTKQLAPVPVDSKQKEATVKTEEALSNQWNIDKTCIFCEEKNAEFNEKTLDLHYWKTCPVLINCPQCNHIVEISSLNEHYHTECEAKDRMKMCTRCLMYVPLTMWEAHTKAKACPVLTPQMALCPLCNLVFDSTSESAWKKHLIADGCPMSPRGKNKKEFEPVMDLSPPVGHSNSNEDKKKKFGLSSWFKKKK